MKIEIIQIIEIFRQLYFSNFIDRYGPVKILGLKLGFWIVSGENETENFLYMWRNATLHIQFLQSPLVVTTTQTNATIGLLSNQLF